MILLLFIPPGLQTSDYARLARNKVLFSQTYRLFLKNSDHWWQRAQVDRKRGSSHYISNRNTFFSAWNLPFQKRKTWKTCKAWTQQRFQCQKLLQNLVKIQMQSHKHQMFVNPARLEEAHHWANKYLMTRVTKTTNLEFNAFKLPIQFTMHLWFTNVYTYEYIIICIHKYIQYINISYIFLYNPNCCSLFWAHMPGLVEIFVLGGGGTCHHECWGKKSCTWDV